MEDRLSRLETPCILWQGPKYPNGYGNCYKRYKGVIVRYAHRWAWIKANKRLPPDGMEVAHICGVRLCIEPKHLELQTHQENMQTARYGKLSKEEIAEIRELRRKGYTYQRIANRYGIHKTTVGRIVRNSSWKEVFQT